MSNTWRILGVDNGTSLLGLALLEYDFDTDIAKVIQLGVLEPRGLAYERYPRIVERKGNNAARRLWMKERFYDILLDIKPDVVAIETPFIGSVATLSSFEPLALSVEALIDTILDVEDDLVKHIDIEKVAPHQAKRAITPPEATYDSSKEAIKVNVLNHPQIDLCGLNLDDYEQDSVDAIAIGWTVVTRLANL